MTSSASSGSQQPLSPGQIRRAYALPARGAPRQTIAIISAFNDPTVQSDLAAYDRYFGLPACTFANGCLTVLNEQGKRSPLPGPDSSGGTWVTESALGTELAHGVCESCRIVLVEATFSDTPDFSVAAQSAAKAGASVIVTTFTPAEPDNESDYAPYFQSPHAAVVAATGDTGYSGPLNFPASLPSVLAAGGTTLTLAHGGYGSESAWSGSVSGCSLYEPAPSWQQRIMAASGCQGSRADADVSAIANPGAIFYASNIQGTRGGAYYSAIGTSVSAPVLGAVIGLAGSVGGRESAMLYARQLKDRWGLHDIVTGEDAPGCRSAICKAGPGWDGPTGLGTPAGLEEFLPGGPVIAPRRPRVTLTLPRDTLHLNRSFAGRLTLANGNPFRITGELTLRDTLRLQGRLRTEFFDTVRLTRTSLQRALLRLSVVRSKRALLRSRPRLWAWLFLRVRGDQGRLVLVRRRIRLLSP